MESAKIEIVKIILEAANFSLDNEIAGQGCFGEGIQKNPHPLGLPVVHEDGEERGGVYVNSWVTTVGKARWHAQCIKVDTHSF
jgi:hypothetical protein